MLFVLAVTCFFDTT